MKMYYLFGLLKKFCKMFQENFCVLGNKSVANGIFLFTDEFKSILWSVTLYFKIVICAKLPKSVNAAFLYKNSVRKAKNNMDTFLRLTWLQESLDILSLRKEISKSLVGCLNRNCA